MSEDTFHLLLKQYYLRLFPYKKLSRWLNDRFQQREFSFTLQGTDGEIYLRYQSFMDHHEMKKEMVKLCPIKIDIGAVFSARPKDHKMIKATAFIPLVKEFVLDIDMTDYDDVRTCCQEASICEKCWKFMIVAMKILDASLRADFGFEHILWVYSGRRGIHAWVCDDRARNLSTEARSAIVEFLSVVKGGEQQSKKVYFANEMHPSLLRAFSVIESHFEADIIIGQDLLGTVDRCRKMLELVPNKNIKEQLIERWINTFSEMSSIDRWVELGTELEFARLRRVRCEIMFQYTYPRLDINVSKQLHHLLKAPFCVHPKTGRICVPIDINGCNEFNPLLVPTLEQLCSEIDAPKFNIINQEVDKENGKRLLSEYKTTSLKPYVDIFVQFLKLCEESTRVKKLSEKMEHEANYMAF